MRRETRSVYQLTSAAAIAAVYVALTLMFLPIAYGPISFRISELLCILPYFTPAAVPGLTVGCLLANFLAGPLPWTWCSEAWPHWRAPGVPTG